MSIYNGKRYRWDDFYAEAERLYAETGSINVPNNFVYNGIPLGYWFSVQRAAFRKNLLKKEKQQRLNLLSFSWKQTLFVDKGEKERWFKKYEVAEQYYTDNGHLDIPTCYCVGKYKLGKWIYQQRVFAKKKKSYSKERVERLNKIGMIWNTQKNIH